MRIAWVELAITIMHAYWGPRPLEKDAFSPRYVAWEHWLIRGDVPRLDEVERRIEERIQMVKNQDRKES